MGGAADWSREANLYEPVRNYLLTDFSLLGLPDTGVAERFVDITANAKGREGEGVWSRPDLAMVIIWKPEFLDGFRVRLYTFEVKTAKGASAESVYEAFAHGRYGHRSYLVWHHDPDDSAYPTSRSIRSACARHGVGLIQMAKPRGPETYKVVASATTNEPDLEVLDEFIAGRFSDTAKRAMRKYMGRQDG